MANDLQIGPESLRKICKDNLKLIPYKFQKAHLLTDNLKKVRMERCKLLVKRFSSARQSGIVFTNECLFNVEAFLNHQNNRILPRSIGDANMKGRIASPSGHPQSVMIFGVITSDGKTPLVLVDYGVKIKSQYYLNDVLIKEVLLWSQSHFGTKLWAFQQDSAPTQKAKIV
ncbi:uncharacterized protein LOC136083515 [Hydra vulgaris]|uniref:Uncharacterized protein LOC136083515 n=1 Tax=Hydra vulgaris TaxID=6087 RepID=A0ABM4CBF7_HYDVU